MATRSTTGSPTDEDIERVANNLRVNYEDVIEDRGTFDKAFEDYFMSDEKGKMGLGAMKSPKQFKENIWKKYLKTYGRDTNSKRIYNEQQSLFRVARGKVLPRDQLKTSKTVYPDTEKGRADYVDATAQRSDLKGLDTKLTKKQERIISLSKRKFDYIGRVKGKSVKARMVYIKVKGKKQRRYIDRKGRYVRVKK